MPLCKSLFCQGWLSLSHAKRYQISKALLHSIGLAVLLLTNPFALRASNIEISWDPNTEPDLAGYRVYYGETPQQYDLGVIDVGAEIKYVFGNLIEDKTYYFVVTAYDTAGNESSPSLEVFIKVPVSDKTPPALRQAHLLDPVTVLVEFSEPVSRASAENKSNYAIDQQISITSAALQADTLVVRLTTTRHAEGNTYTLTVRNIADRATPANVMTAPATANYTLENSDKSPPAVIAATALAETQVEIIFDEPVGRASAENAGNYSITPGLAISSATLQSDERRVLLQTAAHADGVTYQLTARDISDQVSPPNVMQNPAVWHYTYRTDDHDPPRVVSVVMADLTTIFVSFNERVTIPSAEDLSNYRASDGVQVLAARLNDEGQEVRLNTSLHSYNYDYTLTLSGISDATSRANTITSGLTFSYRLDHSEDKSNGGLTVNGWSPANYKLDTLGVGVAYYVDRQHTITNFPSNLNQALLLRTAHRDRRNKSEIFLEFNLNRPADVYIAYDGRVPEVPHWLRHNFVETSQRISLSASGEYMKLWRGRHMPGRVQLGGNMAQGMQYPFTISPNMFFVLVKEADGNAHPAGEAPPKLFEISQNYPNPLRLHAGARRTIIECRVLQESRVVVTIYNMLGQSVRTLHDGILAVGSHPMVWDGRDDNAQSVPSGKYLYAMEIREEVQQGDFTLTTALSRETKVLTVLK